MNTRGQLKEIQNAILELHGLSKENNALLQSFGARLEAVERRVAALETKSVKAEKEELAFVGKDEVARIVKEVMKESGVVFRRSRYSAVLRKEPVYDHFEKYGYTKHETLKALDNAGLLIRGNDGDSCRASWDGKEQKTFRSIMIKLS